MNKAAFIFRNATDADIPAITQLMHAAIAQNMKAFLTAAEIVAAQETMGLDRTLLADGTYFIVETGPAHAREAVACGGWGKRKTLYGGDHTKNRDDRLLDPACEAARIRAMYTHPQWTRQGLGAQLLRRSEQAAQAAGFSAMELGSTLAGEAFYRACGYREYFREEQTGANGAKNVVIHMRKSLNASLAPGGGS